MTAPAFTALERALLDRWQHDLPLVARPYAAMAEALGVEEAVVIEILGRLQAQGAVSRVGATLQPGAVGAGTLAAMAVPPERLEEVAARVSARPEVNHNYEREGDPNLWFVVTAPDAVHLAWVLARLEVECGVPVISLPLVADYHLDLGFALSWT